MSETNMITCFHSLSVLAKTMTNCASGELSISEQGDKSVCEDILNQSANNGTTPMEVNKLITHLKELHTHNKVCLYFYKTPFIFIFKSTAVL